MARSHEYMYVGSRSLFDSAPSMREERAPSKLE